MKMESDFSENEYLDLDTDDKEQKKNLKHRKQAFRESWLKIPALKYWLAEDKEDKYLAKCTLCTCSMTAELTVLKKHANTKKHRRNTSGPDMGVSYALMDRPKSSLEASLNVSDIEDGVPAVSNFKSQLRNLKLRKKVVNDRSASFEYEDADIKPSKDIIEQRTRKYNEIRCGNILFKEVEDIGDMEEIWDRFYAAYDKFGQLIPHVVLCRDCENIFRLGRKDNLNLLNHLCVKKQELYFTDTESDNHNPETPIDEDETSANDDDNDKNEDNYDFSKTKRQHIKKMIDSGIYTLERNLKARSKIWSTFYLIINEENCRIRNYICCIKCRKVYKQANTSTTSSRLRHPCVEQSNEKTIANCHESDTEEKMDITTLDEDFTEEISNEVQYNSSNEFVESDIESIQRDIIKASINFIVQDMRPISIFSGDGYQNLARQLWQMGSQYGQQIDFNEVFPNTEQIATQLQQDANVLRNKIAEGLKLSNCSGTSISVDISQDRINKRNFIGMNVHFIDNDSFVEHSVCVKEINALTAANIESELSTVIKSYSIKPQTKLTIVGDSNSLIHELKSNDKFDVIDCTASVIDRIIENATDHRLLMRQQFETNLQKCYDLIDYLKSSKLDGIVFNNFTETKWNKKFYLFSNIINSWDAIETVLNQPNFEKLLNDIDRNLTNKCFQFLAPFQMAINEIEASGKPVLHLVVLWRKKLLDHLDVNGMDSAIIRNIKELARSYLIDKWNINIQHKVAVFLHPQLKSLRMFNPYEKADIFYETRKLSRQISLGEKETEQVDDSADGNYSERKRIRMYYDELNVCNKSALLDFIDPSETGTENYEDNENDEVSRYVAALFHFDENFDLCQWWFNKKHTYPQLYSLFIRIQCIPATINDSAKLLNNSLTIAQDIINDSRCCMEPIDFDNIMIIKNHRSI